MRLLFEYDEEKTLRGRYEKGKSVGLKKGRKEGIVFKFDDGSELSFEKSIWFSEIIAVKKGCDLIQSFSPTDEFVESWEDDHRGECSREIVELRG